MVNHRLRARRRGPRLIWRREDAVLWGIVLALAATMVALLILDPSTR